MERNAKDADSFSDGHWTMQKILSSEAHLVAGNMTVLCNHANRRRCYWGKIINTERR